MTEGVEVEVKLSVTDPELGRALLDSPDPALLAGFDALTPTTDQVVIDRYVDTADGRLSRAGARARIRTSPGRPVILALKRRGIEQAGVTAREELEAPAAVDLDPTGWPDSPARRALLEVTGGAALVEIARLRQRRRVRIVRRDSTDVELSLDELEALDRDDVVATRWELEAELKAGDRADLEALAAALARLPGIGPATGSKLSFALSARPPRQ